MLVIGAGPAGSAAARVLAQAGADVVLVDQRAFPREKICGDGLISDAIGALDLLGLRDRVMSEAVRAGELRVYAPSGQFVRIRGGFACVPRERLDTLLLEGAIEAGARFMASTSACGPIGERGDVRGARLKSAAGIADIHARFTLLATGANATALDAFGLQVSMKPSGVAGRAYFEAPADVVERYPHLTIAYDRDWCPGYGWIFPAPGNRFNIGVGLFSNDEGPSKLREFWEWFRRRSAQAAAIVAASRQLTPFRGAALRTGLIGAQFGQRGLVVIGEAAAMTYPGTGEGIGKAMESGIVAARFVGDALAGRMAAGDVAAAYEEEFRHRFGSRYHAYQRAQRWAGSPFLLNLLARRANAGRFVREELEALVDERGDPSLLFSRRGMLIALVR